MQLTIPGILPEDRAKLGQLNLLFPTGVSENQELLETLKTEYSQTGLSDWEKKEVAKAIQEAKGRNTREDIEFHEVNIAEDEAGVERLKIRSIPVIIIFRGDEELARKTAIPTTSKESMSWI